MPLGQLPLWIKKASLAIPQTLSLTAFYRDYAGAPWAGTLSAGVSGDGNHDLTAGAAPSNGTALNGYGTAVFDGATTFLNFDGTLDSYVNATSLSGWCLLKPDYAGFGYIFGAGSDRLRIYLDSDALKIEVNSSGTIASKAISTGSYLLATWRYNGTNLQIGINEAPGASGGGTSVSYSSSISDLTVGCGMSDSLLLANIAEFAMSDTALDDSTFGQVKSYINTRYGLSL